MPTKRDYLEYQEITFLGGRISSKKGLEIFKLLSQLGYEEAEQYQIVEFIEWFLDNPDTTLFNVLKEAIKRIGQAHFMPLTSELTKLSMILGQVKSVRDY